MEAGILSLCNSCSLIAKTFDSHISKPLDIDDYSSPHRATVDLSMPHLHISFPLQISHWLNVPVDSLYFVCIIASTICSL